MALYVLPVLTHICDLKVPCSISGSISEIL